MYCTIVCIVEILDALFGHLNGCHNGHTKHTFTQYCDCVHAVGRKKHLRLELHCDHIGIKASEKILKIGLAV